MNKLNILLLADHNNPSHAGTILDHIEALRQLSVHDVKLINPRFGGKLLFIDLNYFDVILIHYSLWIIWESYLSSALVEKIKKSRSLKALFIQDEYRYVNITIDKMVELGIDVLFSSIPQQSLMKVYGDSRLDGVRKETVLTGYASENFLKGNKIPAMKERTIDIGYRSRSTPYWLGKLSREKTLIAEGVLKRAPSLALNCDISVQEHDRIYGKEWSAFLGNCRTVLGTGSGASIVDFDGEVEAKVTEYLLTNISPSFDEVFDKILAPYEGNVVIDTISPRVFESAITRTAQIMFVSPYAGVIKPSIHYIPLKRDFSNLKEISRQIRDHEFLEELTQRTYIDLIANGKYAYSAFSRFVNQVLEEEVKTRMQDGGRVELPGRGKIDTIGLLAIHTSSVMSAHPLIRGYGSTVRLGKVILACLMSPRIMTFILWLIVKDKGRTLRLRGILHELARFAVLRRKKITSLNGRRLRIRTSLNGEEIHFEAMLDDGSEANKTVVAIDNDDVIVDAFKNGMIRKIIWQARLSQLDRPEFFEGASPFISIYSFDALVRMGAEFPNLIGRIVSIGGMERGKG